MKIEEIAEMWSEDSNIDQLNLAGEQVKTVKLHSKYYRHYIEAKMRMRVLEGDRAQLLLLKYDYYVGDLDPDTLKEKGWKPQAKRILKNEVQMYLDADQDLINQNLQLNMIREKVAFLDSIIKSISNRGFAIKNTIDALKFEAGER